MRRKKSSGLASGAERLGLAISGVALFLAAAAAGRDRPATVAGSPAVAEERDELYLPRDPFRPFTIDVGPVADEESLTPLQRVDLRQLKLVGVVWRPGEQRAMVEDDAGLGYILRKGTFVGRRGGVVVLIDPGRVVVEEPYVDFYGTRHTREVVLELRPEEEGS